MAITPLIRSGNRSVLIVLSASIALLAIWPLISLLNEAIQASEGNFLQLSADGGEQILGTFQLLIGSAFFGTVIGAANGWLLSNCRFPGRRWLRIAQLIPLATPAYLLSATLIDLGSRNGILINGIGWAAD